MVFLLYCGDKVFEAVSAAGMAENGDSAFDLPEAQGSSEYEQTARADETLTHPGTIPDKVDTAFNGGNGVLGKFKADVLDKRHNPA
jgi:hypothetical protein